MVTYTKGSSRMVSDMGQASVSTQTAASSLATTKKTNRADMGLTSGEMVNSTTVNGRTASSTEKG